jgi:hypothetical protein
MLSRIFPERVDNRYRGHALALWFFVPIALMKVGISLLHILYADGGAQSISAIPLDSYPAGAAQNVVALFSRMGLEQLLLGLVFAVVLLRYRSLLPLMYVLLAVYYIGQAVIVYAKPLAVTATSGASTPAMILRVLSFAGLILSLWGAGYLKPEADAAPAHDDGAHAAPLHDASR